MPATAIAAPIKGKAPDPQHRARALRTLNFYAPPAYRKDGNPLPRGKK
jgi:hypothetical protein